MINTKNKAKSRLRALMMAANEIKVDGNELVQILTCKKTMRNKLFILFNFNLILII